jgi:lysozyme
MEDIMPAFPAQTCDITIDVSHWQGPNINWAGVKAAGKRVIMIKATTGATGVDSCWPNNIRNAAQQFQIIPYAYVTSEDAAAQAQHFIETAGLKPGMAAAIDWEDDKEDPSQTAFAAQVEMIGRAVENVIGRKPLGYWGANRPGTTPVMATWPRWIPRYGTVDMSHTPQEAWLFWQYTAKGKVDGILPARVDKSLFAGTEDQLIAWCQSGVLPMV